MYQVDQPDKYKCVGCDIRGVKLWRQYNTFASHIELLCAECAKNSEEKKLDLTVSDQIGYLIPAVPTNDGSNTYWGYTSVPQEGVDWWLALPLKEGETILQIKIVNVGTDREPLYDAWIFRNGLGVSGALIGVEANGDLNKLIKHCLSLEEVKEDTPFYFLHSWEFEREETKNKKEVKEPEKIEKEIKKN